MLLSQAHAPLSSERVHPHSGFLRDPLSLMCSIGQTTAKPVDSSGYTETLWKPARSRRGVRLCQADSTVTELVVSGTNDSMTRSEYSRRSSASSVRCSAEVSVIGGCAGSSSGPGISGLRSESAGDAPLESGGCAGRSRAHASASSTVTRRVAQTIAFRDRPTARFVRRFMFSPFVRPGDAAWALQPQAG